MREERAVPEVVDVTTPNVARMYDYWLGGKDNFAVDREAADAVVSLASEPGVLRSVRANREFLGRAVRVCVEAGVTRFLDVGSGLPTQDNVHDVARRFTPDADVVYVDDDPVVCAHGQAILTRDDRVSFVRGDLRRPETILEQPDVARLVGAGEPVALLLVSVLHFLSADQDPGGVVARFRDALPSGSHLIVSHLTDDSRADEAEQAVKVYEHASAGLHPRSSAEITRLFDGFELLEPGLTTVAAWHPDHERDLADAHKFTMLAGVGRKP
jgi:archaeosine-15-forming tRNA-guanine transglycosylase